MKITRQADYAIHAVLYLSRAGADKFIATHKIAHEQSIPISFLAKIISQLAIKGILTTSRGSRGGVSLAREPSKISILEVVEAIDGTIQLNECVEPKGLCAFKDDCPVRMMWCDAQDQLTSKLANTNFAQLIA